MPTAAAPATKALPSTPAPTADSVVRNNGNQHGAHDANERLPLDSTIRTGKLDNGLTYYVRQNAEPAKQRSSGSRSTGSVMEDDNQKGLAHFLEHMLFKGTQRFPGLGLLDFLQGIGMKFGPDINASTSFDETVYTLQIPTDKETDFSKAFDVLQDWAGTTSLSPQDFDKERRHRRRMATAGRNRVRAHAREDCADVAGRLAVR